MVSSAGARPTQPPPRKLHVGPPIYLQAKWKVKVVLHRMRFSSDFAFHSYSFDF